MQLYGAVRRYRQSEHCFLIYRTASLSHHAALVGIAYQAAAAVDTEWQVYLGTVDIKLLHRQAHRALVEDGRCAELCRQRPLYDRRGGELTA